MLAAHRVKLSCAKAVRMGLAAVACQRTWNSAWKRAAPHSLGNITGSKAEAVASDRRRHRFGCFSNMSVKVFPGQSVLAARAELVGRLD